jgi:hypothetical protein
MVPLEDLLDLRFDRFAQHHLDLGFLVVNTNLPVGNSGRSEAINHALYTDES